MVVHYSIGWYVAHCMSTTQPKLIEVHILAAKLLREHGLENWTFDFNTNKQRVGVCDYSKRRIGYSLDFLDKTPIDEIRDTILHEIAHALVGPGHGHDEVWRAKAHSIGAKATRCAEGAITSAKPRYIISCPKCNLNWKRYRLKKAMHTAVCPVCNVKVTVFRVKT